MKVLKNADLSGKQIFGSKVNCKACRNSDFTFLNFVEWFCYQKPKWRPSEKCFQPCPLKGTENVRKRWTPKNWWPAVFLRSPAHDQLQQASLGVDLPTFLGIFFLLKSLGSKIDPTWMPVVWTSELPADSADTKSTPSFEVDFMGGDGAVLFEHLL